MANRPEFMMYVRMIVLVILMVWVEILPARGARTDDFVVYSMNGLPGRLHVPDGYIAGQMYPLILFLHGAGERGSDNVLQINANIDLLLEAAEVRSAFLYAPQSSSGIWATTAATPMADLANAVAMIHNAKQVYTIDRDRVYVTGLSSGGGGTWDALAKYPGEFAAGVPICGTFGAALFRPTLIDKPIWAFHSQDDPIVPVTRSEEMVNAIVTAKGHEAFTFAPLAPKEGRLYTDEPQLFMEGGSGGHAIWSAVYAYEPMRDWLFTQSLPEPGVMAEAGWVIVFLRRSRRFRPW
jgi:predicted peptidase